MQQKATNDDIQQSWIEAELRLAGGLDSRMIGLLRAIKETGSINQAAKQAGLSYKGAWQMIERANNLAPKVLVSTATGGSKGGGTVLTPAGLALLALYDRLEHLHRQFLAQLNRELLDDPVLSLLLKSMAVKSSATNQLLGKVADIQAGIVNIEVYVDLKGGEQMVASMSVAEFDLLSLNKGDDVLLLIAIPEISIVTDETRYRLSARNALKGKVIRLQQDGIDSEVVIRLAGGESIVAMVTRASADTLDLKTGTAVTAVFKSNAVLLGAMATGVIRQ